MKSNGERGERESGIINRKGRKERKKEGRIE